MWLSPSLLLIILSIITRIFLVVSSPSLFVAWIGLELNTLAFIPLLLIKKTKITVESSIKYFLTQTLASILIIIGGLTLIIFIREIGAIFIFLGIIIKLGGAPFHRWVVRVAESLPWISLFILLTVQKINPLFLIWNFCDTRQLFYNFIVIRSLVVGGLVGLAQTRTRALITFSSINHVGWLLASLNFDIKLGVLYFSTYLIILLVPVLIFFKTNISHLNQLPFIKINLSAQVILFFSLLSLGGLPPFLGFLPKWIILQLLCSHSFFLLRLIIVIISLLTLFFYLRLIFSAFIFGGMSVLGGEKDQLSFFHVFLFTISVGGLFLVYLI